VSKILTTKELAEYLKLTEVTIYKYANEGKIPGFKIGSRWRFDKEKIDDLLKWDVLTDRARRVSDKRGWNDQADYLANLEKYVKNLDI